MVRQTANWDIALNPYGGNVGIGTAGPTSKLQVVDSHFDLTAGNKNGISIADDAFGIGLFTPALGFGYNGNFEAGLAGVYGSADNNQLGLMFFTHPSATSTADAVEAMRITYDGNVGIGTTDPGGKLHVYGGTTAFTNLSDNTDSVQITRRRFCSFTSRCQTIYL